MENLEHLAESGAIPGGQLMLPGELVQNIAHRSGGAHGIFNDFLKQAVIQFVPEIDRCERPGELIEKRKRFSPKSYEPVLLPNSLFSLLQRLCNRYRMQPSMLVELALDRFVSDTAPRR